MSFFLCKMWCAATKLFFSFFNLWNWIQRTSSKLNKNVEYIFIYCYWTAPRRLTCSSVTLPIRGCRWVSNLIWIGTKDQENIPIPLSALYFFTMFFFCLFVFFSLYTSSKGTRLLQQSFTVWWLNFGHSW